MNYSTVVLLGRYKLIALFTSKTLKRLSNWTAFFCVAQEIVNNTKGLYIVQVKGNSATTSLKVVKQ